MAPGANTKVLLVDDDPIVLSIYGRGLTKRGMQVETATDGLSAIKAVRQTRPDVVVLDLMMPSLSGVEVLKFLRAEKGLSELPVVVLSNAYMSDLARDAAALGAQKALLKVGCNPGLLAEAIREVLEGAPLEVELSRLVAAPELIPPPERPAPVVVSDAPAEPPAAPAPAPPSKTADTEVQAQARADFLRHAPNTRAALRRLFETFKNAPVGKEREFALESFYRKLHFITATAGLAGCYRLAELASAFEAMLYQAMDQPARITASAARTAGLAMDFLEELLGRAGTPEARPEVSPGVLVVDADALSNRLVVTALRQAGLQAQSTPDAGQALGWLRDRHYDLVLLDTGLSRGLSFQNVFRRLPGHADTPVIYLSAQAELESRRQTAGAATEEVITKPVLSTELALRVVMHFLRSKAWALGAATGS